MQRNDSEENGLSYSKDEVRVPIHLKMTLTIKEVAEYSNIGINKIDTNVKAAELPVCSVCWNTKAG